MLKFLERFWKGIFFFLLLTLPVQNLITQTIVFKLNLPEFLALYKEFLIVVLILTSLFFIILQTFENRQKLLLNKESFTWLNFFKNKMWIIPILIFLILNLIIIFSSLLNKTELFIFLIGYRFELFWLGFFAFSISFVNFLKKNNQKFLGEQFAFDSSRIVLIGFILVLFIVLIQAASGISNFNEFFTPVQEIDSQAVAQETCHRIDFNIEVCRLNGPFSSPNHFSGYLLFLLPFLSLILLSSTNLLFNQNFLKISPEYLKKILGIKKEKNVFRYKTIIFFTTILLFISNLTMIFYSYSRYSWLGSLLFLSILFLSLSLEKFKAFNIFNSKICLKIWKFGVFFGLFVSFFFGLVVINIDPYFVDDLPDTFNTIVKPSSTTGHYRHFQASLNVYKEAGITRQLLGFGLGSSGPAGSYQYQDMSQNSIVLNHFEIAEKWGLIGFHLGVPENWFLQVLLNGGIFYLIFYLILISFIYLPFYESFKLQKFSEINFAKILIYLPFHLIVFGNLLLHIWENQTLAFYWSLVYLIAITYSNITIFDIPKSSLKNENYYEIIK
jgi:hypothetical protein